MNASDHAKVLMAFEKAFVEAAERGGLLAAERAAKLGLAVPYSDGVNLFEALPDGTVRMVKALKRADTSANPPESEFSFLADDLSSFKSEE